jgi:hypothetical protein
MLRQTYFALNSVMLLEPDLISSEPIFNRLKPLCCYLLAGLPGSYDIPAADADGPSPLLALLIVLFSLFTIRDMSTDKEFRLFLVIYY